MPNKKNELDWPGIAPQFGRRKAKKVDVTITRARTKAANDDGANRKIKITVKRRKTTTTGAL